MRITRYQQWLKDNDIEYKADGFMDGYQIMGRDFLKMVEEKRTSRPGMELKDYRLEAIRQFSFAIPTDETIGGLLRHGPFLEVGAGLGYWAFELSEAGADIIASDPAPYSCISDKLRGGKTWGRIETLSAITAIELYGRGRTLLIVWPSYDDPWAKEALEEFIRIGGRKVVYVGEGFGGCTADDGFHQLLDASFDFKESIPMPRWGGIHDRCEVYLIKERS